MVKVASRRYVHVEPNSDTHAFLKGKQHVHKKHQLIKSLKGGIDPTMFSQNDFHSKNMQRQLIEFIADQFQNVNEDFLDLFEKHEVIIIEDGTDLKRFKPDDRPHNVNSLNFQLIKIREKNPYGLENSIEDISDDFKQIRVDVNRLKNKYDYHLASKVFKHRSAKTFVKESQDAFKQAAYLELLHDASILLARGNREFHSLFDFKTHRQIKNLDEITADCKILLASTQPIHGADKLASLKMRPVFMRQKVTKITKKLNGNSTSQSLDMTLLESQHELNSTHVSGKVQNVAKHFDGYDGTDSQSDEDRTAYNKSHMLAKMNGLEKIIQNRKHTNVGLRSLHKIKRPDPDQQSGDSPPVINNRRFLDVHKETTVMASESVNVTDEEEQEEPKFITEIDSGVPKPVGLKNNLYEFKSAHEKRMVEKGLIEQCMYDRMVQFYRSNVGEKGRLNPTEYP